MNFIWIDDNPDRETSAKNLAETMSVDCNFINVENKEVGEEIKKLLSDKEPDLIIIDHNLINVTDKNEEIKILIRKGSSAASIIRQQWKACPIICISGDALNVDSQEKSIYEETYPIEKISNFYSEIHSIASSFKKIRNKTPKDTTDLLSLLGCPEIESERMKAIIPKTLKENFNDGGLIVEISNWVRKVLLVRPGFLYDELWSATLLGLTPQGFEKVKPLFNNAKYVGIFSNENSPRWWKAELIRTLGEHVNQPGLPAHKGRLLEGINEEDYSKCSVFGEPFPETVAFTDETPHAKQKPMKLKETILHPDYEKLLFFDDIRLMAPAQ